MSTAAGRGVAGRRAEPTATRSVEALLRGAHRLLEDGAGILARRGWALGAEGRPQGLPRLSAQRLFLDRQAGEHDSALALETHLVPLSRHHPPLLLAARLWFRRPLPRPVVLGGFAQSPALEELLDPATPTTPRTLFISPLAHPGTLVTRIDLAGWRLLEVADRGRLEAALAAWGPTSSWPSSA
jgi:hypothetical protein